jgi:trimeric autotransporter adhesin
MRHAMRHGLLGLLLLWATAGEAANYPHILSSITSFNTSDQTTTTVTLPDSIVAGNLLLIVYAVDGTPSSTTTWPAGWTVCSALTYDPDGAVGLEVRYRVADGTEGASIEVTLSPTNQFSAVALRITDYTGTPSCGTPVTTATATPVATFDPPSYTAPWGAADNLWIAAMANDDGRRTAVWPALTYATTPNVLFFHAISSVAGGASTHAVTFASANATEDPGTIGINASEEWVANTLVIQGAAPAGGGGGGGGGIIGG